MKIKFIQEVSGVRDGKPWPKRGELIDWADAEAADLIRAGIAEVDEPEPAAPVAAPEPAPAE